MIDGIVSFILSFYGGKESYYSKSNFYFSLVIFSAFFFGASQIVGLCFMIYKNGNNYDYINCAQCLVYTFLIFIYIRYFGVSKLVLFEKITFIKKVLLFSFLILSILYIVIYG